MNGFQKLFELLKLERVEITSIYFYAIMSGLVQLSLPLGIQAIIGFVMGATMVTSVYVLIFFIVLGTLTVGLLRINQKGIIEKIQQKIFVRYSLAFAQKVPNFDSKGIDNYFLPEKINRFFETLNIQKGISKLLLDIPIATIQILLGLLLLSFYHPLFIAFDAILIMILFVLLRYTYTIGLSTSIEESNHKYTVVAWLQEIGRVIKSLKFSNGSAYCLTKTDNLTVNYVNSRTSHYKVLSFQFKTIVFFKTAITALMLLLGTYLLFNQLLNIGEFVAIEIVLITVISSLEKLINSLESVYDVITGLIKIDSLLENQKEDDGVIAFAPNVGTKIEFKNVSFSFDENQLVFNQLNFSISPCSVVTLSGNDGSGKSTLLKLIAGIYQDYKGMILLNDILLRNYSLQSFRGNTGILLHEHDIFEGNVYDNIVIGKQNISVESIMELSQKLGIEDFISFLPKAFETQLDPLGRKLPASLIKKLLLLRALIGNPELVLLEEPCLGLEPHAKSKTIQFLKQLSSSKTIVISSNDADLIENCDRNIFIENYNTIIKK